MGTGALSADTACSPHTRGWTVVGQRPWRYRRWCSPHTRGWTGWLVAVDGRGLACSPHTRGWTGRGAYRVAPRLVFPAHAGMDRAGAGAGTAGTACSPHTRGWTVAWIHAGDFPEACSPHTRGWTVGVMFPPKRHQRVPRTRGDGPLGHRRVAVQA